MSQSRSKLYWRCRRGMLELDLLLQRFLGHGYGSMDEQGRRVFEEKVLEFSDQDLHDYLFGTKQPDDKEVARVIESIRSAQN